MEEENELTSVSSIGGKPIKKVIEADFIQIEGTPTYVLSQTSVDKIVEYKTEVLLYKPEYYSNPNQPFYYQLVGVFDNPIEAIKFSSIYQAGDGVKYRELICDLTEPIYETEDEKYYSLKWEEYELNGGSNLTAGTDLVINEGVISVNTNGTIGNSDDMSFVAGQATYASGVGAVAFGGGTRAIGEYAYAEGAGSLASATTAHAEGAGTSAFGDNSHTEGGGNKTYEKCSHAEGGGTLASQVNSHAEGYHTSAAMTAAHAEGEFTIAGDGAMHVCGKYNKTSANAAFVIGNGSNSNRSDAFVVDWNGNVSAAGLKINSVWGETIVYSDDTSTRYLSQNFTINNSHEYSEVMGLVSLSYTANSSPVRLALVPWNFSTNTINSYYINQCSNVIVPNGGGTVTIPFYFNRKDTNASLLPNAVAIKGNGNHSITAFMCLKQER